MCGYTHTCNHSDIRQARISRLSDSVGASLRRLAEALGYSRELKIQGRGFG